MKQGKAGALLSIKITKANGEVVEFKDIPNIIGNIGLASNTRLSGGSATQISFRQHASPMEYVVTGTFSQAAGVVSRASGSFDLSTIANGSAFRFGTGEWGYRISAINSTSFNASKSQTVAATSLRIWNTNNDNTAGVVSDLSNQAMTRSFAAGVLSFTLNAAGSFPVSASAYTLSRIQANIASSYSHFDLPAPVSIDIGDQVTISSYVFTATFDNIPQEFAASPITGLSGAGRYQRLKQCHISESATAPTRIYLLSDANKITPIPNCKGPSDAVINPSTLTAIEEITASNTIQGASYTNNGEQAIQSSGAAAVGGSVKQIVWGTTTEAFGVIEYDTPVTINPGHVITIRSALTMNVVP